jgi:hypothetical protein
MATATVAGRFGGESLEAAQAGDDGQWGRAIEPLLPAPKRGQTFEAGDELDSPELPAVTR